MFRMKECRFARPGAPMPTKTQTTTTHYHIQKKRRADFIEEWRKYRQSVIREEDVALVPTARHAHRRLHGKGWRSPDAQPRCAGAGTRTRSTFPHGAGIATATTAPRPGDS
jgi:hypothetical protein